MNVFPAHNMPVSEAPEPAYLLQVMHLNVDEYAACAAEFADLAHRAADPNPHMSPAAICAAATMLGPDEITILGVRNQTGDKLLGVWALSQSRPAWALGLAVMKSPPLLTYDVLSLPVIDASQLIPVLARMLHHIKNDPLLPKLIRCPSIAMDGPTGQAMNNLLSGHKGQLALYESWQRAIFQPVRPISAEAYLRNSMGSAYKRCLSRRRALEATGTIHFAMHRKDAAIEALPRFLALECAGWKGAAGSAMASKPRDAAFAQALVSGLAAQDDIIICELARDGIALAMALLPVSAGTICFTKTAYDENERKFSPGVLLDMEITSALINDPSFSMMDTGMDDSVDAGSVIWSERQPMAHGLIALGTAPRAWLASHGLALRQRLRSARQRNVKG